VKYQPLVKRALSQFVNDLVNEKIQNALKTDEPKLDNNSEINDAKNSAPAHQHNDIITTEEELQAFYIVRSILAPDIPIERIQYKDTVNYFGILLDGKTTKWICRLSLRDTSKCVYIIEN